MLPDKKNLKIENVKEQKKITDEIQEKSIISRRK